MPTKVELQREVARLRRRLRHNELLMRQVLQQFEAIKGAEMALIITRDKVQTGRRPKAKVGSSS